MRRNGWLRLPSAPVSPRRLAGVALLLLGVGVAHAYGPEGHLITGRAAEPLLCARASLEVERLGDGDDLGELGLWADRVRSDDAYRDSGPWHYINIDTGARLEDFEHPPEGDVLEAIERFSERLGDASLGTAPRAEALRFLVHFVVDIHQPLHVGLAADRGGNAVALRFRGETTNLHRYWDTHAIELAGLSLDQYVARLSVAARVAAESELGPLGWAAESLALRSRVYAFGPADSEPGPAYQQFAAAATEERLGLAAARLAVTLNSLLCD